jgi:hypothetical protein
METVPPEQYFANGYVRLWISRWALHTSITRQIVDCVAHEDIPAQTVGCARADLRLDLGRQQADGSIVDMHPSSPPRLMPPNTQTELFQLDKNCYVHKTDSWLNMLVAQKRLLVKFPFLRRPTAPSAPPNPTPPHPHPSPHTPAPQDSPAWLLYSRHAGSGGRLKR